MKVKKMLSVAVAVVAVLSSAGLFGGCAFGGEKQPTVYEDGYFQYCVVKYSESNSYGDAFDYGTKAGDEVIAIVGLTESGQEQEVIDFPGTIGGKRVAYLGWVWQRGITLFLAVPKQTYYYVGSPNLKKAYIPMSLHSIKSFAFRDLKSADNFLDTKSLKNLKLVFHGDPPPNANAESCLPVESKFYFRDRTIASKSWGYVNGTILEANIAFMNNYSDEANGGYYRIDNMDKGEKIPIPLEPVREGYRFVGWYTEPECIKLWDFNIAPFTENADTKAEEAERLYLYAGWESNL